MHCDSQKKQRFGSPEQNKYVGGQTVPCYVRPQEKLFIKTPVLEPECLNLGNIYACHFSICAVSELTVPWYVYGLIMLTLLFYIGAVILRTLWRGCSQRRHKRHNDIELSFVR